MFQILAFVRKQCLRPKFVNRVCQQQNFDIFFAECFQQRVARQRLRIVSGDVVNCLLVFAHTFDIGIKRCQFVFALGRIKTRQFGHFFAVCKVLINSFLKRNTECVPELCIILLVLRAFFQLFEQAGNRSLADFCNQSALLQHFA